MTSDTSYEMSIFRHGFYCVEMSEIVLHEDVFALTRAIMCPIKHEDGMVFIEYEPLGIVAAGQTLAEAKQDFCEEFVAAWDIYALADDDELTAGAVALKRHLRDLVREDRCGETTQEASNGSTAAGEGLSTRYSYTLPKSQVVRLAS